MTLNCLRTVNQLVIYSVCDNNPIEKQINPVSVSPTDFIQPQSDNGSKDYMGMFACAIIGAKELCARFEKDLDDYGSIMIKALADRLAEALAEYLHYRVRTEFWGYSPNEAISPDQMIGIKYQGIRPAPGYPTQPDHLEKHTLWTLMKVVELTGIQLTDSLAMDPAASVSGLYFSHPQSVYFSVGKLDKDQVEDYALRRNKTVKEVEQWLGPNLGYDRD